MNNKITSQPQKLIELINHRLNVRIQDRNSNRKHTLGRTIFTNIMIGMLGSDYTEVASYLKKDRSTIYHYMGDIGNTMFDKNERDSYDHIVAEYFTGSGGMSLLITTAMTLDIVTQSYRRVLYNKEQELDRLFKEILFTEIDIFDSDLFDGLSFEEKQGACKFRNELLKRKNQWDEKQKTKNPCKSQDELCDSNNEIH